MVGITCFGMSCNVMIVRAVCFCVSLQVVFQQVALHNVQLAVASKAETEDADTLDDSGFAQKQTMFEAEKGWKEIKEGEVLPAGLHVRINLRTGKREAKLLEENGNEENKITQLSETWDKKSNNDDSHAVVYDKKELKRVLLNLNTHGENEVSNASEKYLSYDEIKKEFADLNITMKMDFQIIHEILNKFNNADLSSKDNVQLMLELEYLLHQYDNALYFVKKNGLSRVIMPSLNSSREDISSTAAFLLGAAVQSNPEVQEASVKMGVLPLLLKSIHVSDSFLVKKRCLYALSCLVRHSALAQEEMIRNGGLTVLEDLFRIKSIDYEQLHLKVMILIQDLLTERQEALRADLNSFANQEKLKQYQRIPLDTLIKEHSFCYLISHWLGPIGNSKVPNNHKLNHDTFDKLINTMLSMVDICYQEFQFLKNVLIQLKDQYTLLYDQEKSEQSEFGQGMFYKDMWENINLLITKLTNKRIDIKLKD